MTLILAVLQTINQPSSRMMVNRNIIVLQNQTETHCKMIVPIIQEQSQKQPKIILRAIVGRSFSTEGTVQKIHKNQIQSFHHHHRLILARTSLDLEVMKDKSQRYKKEASSVAPRFLREDRRAAIARIEDAPKQVDPSVYLDPKIKRTTETLYVGNLDFSTSDEDPYLAVRGLVLVASGERYYPQSKWPIKIWIR